VFGYALMSIRCLVILVLAFSAFAKVRDRSAMAEFGRALEVGLGLPQSRLLAAGWVAGEAATALLLVLPPTAAIAAVLATVQFGCLTVGVTFLVARRRGFRCTCFGGGGSELGWPAVLRNAALTLAALLLAAGLRRPAATAPAPVALAAILSVLVATVLVWQARPLRALVAQSVHQRPAIRPVEAGRR
jgi:hypothetical protein